MKKKVLVSIVFALFSGFALAQMSDEAVIAYIKNSVQNGKNQTQIAKELMSRGVSSDQVQRIQKMYKDGTLSIILNDSSKEEMMDVKKRTEASTQSRTRLREIGTNSYNDSSDVVKLDSLFSEKEGKEVKKERKGEKMIMWNGKMMPVYGHDFFDGQKLSFEPNVNMPTPSDYVIGPEDEIIIDVWGVNEITIHEAVSPDGKIYIEQIGPVNVAGLTIKQAGNKLRKVLSQKYSLSGPDAESDMSVTLGNIRSIQVNIIGEVKKPGTYRLSSLSNVMTALYCAGGVTPIGSLRTVQVARGGKIIATADLYSYIFDGTVSDAVALKDGDAVIVPSYSTMVEMGEGFKRPMLYESISGEPVERLVRYAGGFASNATDAEVSVERKNGADGTVFSVRKSEYGSFGVMDGDIVIGHLNETDVFENRIEVKGSVLRPGVYALGGEIATVRQLVERSGGLLDDAFLPRAQLIREKADRSFEVIAIALGAIVNGTAPDVLLRKNDILLVSNANEINPKGDITISGYVTNPGDYEFAEGMGIEDLIMLAGGLENGASSVRIDVARRIYDDASTAASDTIAQIFTCGIEDGMLVDGTPDFVLQPYDVVAVRKSPTYVEQKKVRVTGEITFPGEYALVVNQERLSEIYKRAGGATPNGYVSGAMIKRKMNDDERNLRLTLMTAARNRTDTTAIRALMNVETYTMGISLDKALAAPGGEFDVILRDGDELIVPEMTNSVTVQGEVLYPNSVSYVQGQSVKNYIKQAGGFTQDAKRSKVFVVYMNGNVGSGLKAEVVPGCEIYVPSKPEHHQLSVGEWMSIGTTAASISTMIASIVNLIKK